MNNTRFVNYWKMQNIAAVFIVVSLLSCFSINYTFPLHRDAGKLSVSANNTQKYKKASDRVDVFVDRTKKMAANIENALKKIMDTAQGNDNIRKDVGCSHAQQGIIDSDLSNYEQLVIMKKYPYLDLKELENYHSMSHKNARQSLHSGGQDTNFCELSDNDGLNVDITNRGLTGFAIPTKLLKNEEVHQPNNIQSTSQTAHHTKSQSSIGRPSDLFNSLQEDILKFEEKLL